MTRDIVIRPFEDHDWPAIRAIIGHVLAEGDSYAYDAGLTDDGYRALWLEAPPGRTMVAQDRNGAILGTAKMGRNRPGPGAHVATASFMVHPDGRGGGIGRKLGEHAIAWATQQGFRAMQFNAVVADNVAAVALWRALGFEIVGSVPDAFRHRDGRFVDLLVMYRRL